MLPGALAVEGADPSVKVKATGAIGVAVFVILIYRRRINGGLGWVGERPLSDIAGGVRKSRSAAPPARHSKEPDAVLDADIRALARR